MSSTLFTEMLEHKQMRVERTFDAPVERVWAAWTTRELLEQWWAPMPFRAVTKAFDFREGGEWHYCMEGPEGERHWCLVSYLAIEPQQSFSARDAFCDEDKNINPDMPGNDWRNEFSADGDGTRVLVTLTFTAAEDMQTIIDMGFKEGFSMGLDQLAALLAKG